MNEVIRPQIVAHRGASAEKAEHTLEAYLAAIDQGADAFECDVRLTADGHLVCIHDRDLRRTAANRGLVSTMKLDELDGLDFSSWKQPWADMDDEYDAPPPSKVLQLRTLLETVRDAGRPIELAIETKHPTRYGPLVEERLLDLLREFDWVGSDSPIRVMSFSYRALQRVRLSERGLRVVQLIKRARDWPMYRRTVGRSWIIGPGIKELREHPGLGRALVESGREIHVWTVNTEADLELCLSLGVRAVISDKPGYMKELLDARFGPTAVAGATMAAR